MVTLPHVFSSFYKQTIHSFINKQYGVHKNEISVDEARLQLLLHKVKSFDDMPSNSDAIEHEMLRTAYQAGLIC